MHLLAQTQRRYGPRTGYSSGFPLETPQPIAMGASNYPDPLPEGMTAVAASGWGIAAYFDHTLPLVTATATITGPSGELVDRMTLSFGGGNAGTATSHIEKGTQVFDAIEGPHGSYLAGLHFSDWQWIIHGLTNEPVSDSDPINTFDLVWKWSGPRFYRDLEGFNDGTYAYMVFPVSKVQIPFNSTVTVSINDDPANGSAFLFLATNNNIHPSVQADGAKFVFTSRGNNLDGYTDPDVRTLLTRYPTWPDVASFEYWWIDEATGEWNHLTGSSFEEDFFSSKEIYILLKDEDAGQVIVKYPLVVQDRGFETSVEVRSKMNGHVFRAIETMPTTFLVDNLYYNALFVDALTVPRHIEIVEVVNGKQITKFVPLYSNPEIVGEYGIARSPELIQLRTGTMIYLDIVSYLPPRRLTANSSIWNALGVAGGGIGRTFVTRNEWKTVGVTAKMFDTTKIRVAKLLELTDGALACVAVSSDAGSGNASTGAPVRKLLWKRSVSVTSNELSILTVVWPADSSAIEIATLDRVEVWTPKQTPDGTIIIENGRGQRYTSTTARPTSPGDFTFSQDEVAS